MIKIFEYELLEYYYYEKSLLKLINHNKGSLNLKTLLGFSICLNILYLKNISITLHEY